jgi:starvation-inducible DNA-binding protein
MKTTKVDLAPDAKAEIVEGLTQGLAETAVETMKAQNYHWNVTGMAFGQLHELFQTIYVEHFKAQDEIAERIKALDAHAEGRLGEYLKRSAIKECDGHIDDRKMLKNLQKDQETLAATMRALADMADRHGDVVTNDLAIERADAHEKFAWMLRAHLAA